MATTDVVSAAAPRAPALPPGLGPAAERFARTTLRKSAQTQRTYASAYARFTTWLAAYTELAEPAARSRGARLEWANVCSRSGIILLGRRLLLAVRLQEVWGPD